MFHRSADDLPNTNVDPDHFNSVRFKVTSSPASDCLWNIDQDTSSASPLLIPSVGIVGAD